MSYDPSRLVLPPLLDLEVIERIKGIAHDRYRPRVMGIRAHNLDPNVSQYSFVFGDDDGSESGYTADTQGNNRTYAVDGGGNVQLFVDILLYQSETGADQNLTRTYELRYQKNGTGGYNTVPTSGGYSSEGIRLYNSSNITDGGATSSRFSGPASAAFLAGEIIDGAGDATFDSITWDTKPTNGQWTRLLACVEIVDADTSAGDYYEFRVYESGGTALAGGYTTTPRVTWNAGATDIQPSPVSAAFSINAPSVEAVSVDLNPSPASAAYSINAPSVQPQPLDVNPTPPSAAYSINAPSITTPTNVQPSPVSAVLSINAPLVNLGAVDIAPTPLQAALGIPSPSLAFSAVDIAPTPISAAYSIPAPSISQASFINPNNVAAAFAVQAPSFSLGQLDMAPSPLAAVLSIVAPSVQATGAVDISPTPVTAAWSTPAPHVTEGGAPTAKRALLSLLELLRLRM